MAYVPTGKSKGWSKGRQFAPRRACAICGTQFYAPPALVRRGGGVYCSYVCKGLAMRKPEQTRTCRGCGAKFVTSDITARRCATCVQAAQPKPLGKCEQCGGHARGNFCNMACYTAYRRANPKAKGLSPTTNCAKCGKPFYASPGRLRAGWGKYCSMRCRPLSRSGNGKGGIRADLDLYVRSSWEANYARYLNWLKSRGEIDDWQYEPDTFEFPVKRGTRFYTPDFKLFEGGSFRYVEVKGYMSPKSKTQLRRMAKYYPAVAISVVAQPEMRALARSVGSLIPHWERNANDKIHNGVALDRIVRALMDREAA